MLVAALLVLTGIAIAADRGPLLPETRLYSSTARDCRPIDLETWNDATKNVLGRYSVTVDKVESCNQDRYKIFTVRFQYDPRTNTEKFFYPLYSHLLNANGGDAYSFVALMDGVIVSIKPDGENRISVEYENFRH